MIVSKLCQGPLVKEWTLFVLKMLYVRYTVCMKVLSLNIWGGRVHEKLIPFLKRHAGDGVDVFCFQEVYDKAHGKEVQYLDAYMTIFDELCSELPEYVAYYRPHLSDYYGVATFVKKSLPVVEEGEEYVHLHKGYIPDGEVGFHAKNIQYCVLDTPSGKSIVVNFHGLWNAQGKGDTDARLQQSKNIHTFLTSRHEKKKILCGDFNLLPETKSLAILEDGMRNLITEYGITSTRTSLYPKPLRFADYMLVSPDVEVLDFKVLPDEVSDHAALLLECN
jgi:exonuclease III